MALPRLLLHGVSVVLLAVGCGVPLLPQNGPSGPREAKPSEESLKELGSSSSHCHLKLSEPRPGLPQIIGVGNVNGLPIFRYDSCTWKMEPLASWGRKVGQNESQYWEKESQDLQDIKKHFEECLATLQDHFHHHHSTGLHTLQFLFSCEMGPDGQPRGESWKYAFDGGNLLAFISENTTWKAFMPLAEILKQTVITPQQLKHHMKGICVGWFQRSLGYGSETLQRTETPKVRLACKKGNSSQETLICWVYGFFPKKINITLMKDGEEQKAEKFVLPNSDGTYYSRISIDVDPKDKNLYRCHVEHDSLPSLLDLAWEEPATNLWHLLVIFVGILIGAMFIIFLEKLRRQEGGNTTLPRNTYVEADSSFKGNIDKETDRSFIGDSGRTSLYSEVGDSDQESDSCSKGESIQMFPLSGDGDSGQVSFCSRDRESGKESSSFKDGEDICGDEVIESQSGKDLYKTSLTNIHPASS